MQYKKHKTTYANESCNNEEELLKPSRKRKKVTQMIENENVFRLLKSRPRSRKTTQQYHQNSEKESKSKLDLKTTISIKFENKIRIHADMRGFSKNLPSTHPLLGS